MYFGLTKPKGKYLPLDTKTTSGKIQTVSQSKQRIPAVRNSNAVVVI